MTEEVSLSANWTPTRSLVNLQPPSYLLHAKANLLIPPRTLQPQFPSRLDLHLFMRYFLL